MQPLKIVFIINPVSGNGHKKPGADFISKFFDSTYKISFVESTKSGHASELASEAMTTGADAVIAIGGDGTVNEIAKSLNGTRCALGIIPCGSGNGLARHHEIPFDVPAALDVIKRFNVIEHDSVSINGKLSFNVSGIGFDAHVAHLFGKNGKRGFSSYLKLVIQEFSGYNEQEIKITTSEGVIRQPVMLAAIANASQFGNNARISPLSDTHDGISNITLIRKMNALQLPLFMFNVFTRKVGNSSYANLLRGEKFLIESEKELPLHIDGEPAGFGKRFEIETLKASLRIILP